MRYINEFREGDNVSDIYLCKLKNIAKTKAGKTYYSLILQDKTGVIDTKIWELNNGIDNFEQMDLFTDAARIDKQEKLDRAADALRRKFGGAAVTRATLLNPDTRKPEALSAAKEREKDKK